MNRPNNVYPIQRTRPAPRRDDLPATVIIVCLILIGLAWIAWLAGGADQ